MASSRRDFLGTLLAAGAVIPLRTLGVDGSRKTGQDAGTHTPPAGPATPAGFPATLHGGNLLNMSAQSFMPFVNSGFTLLSGKQTLGLTLVSVTQLSAPAPPTNLASFAVMPPAYYLNPIVTDAFALDFRGPANLRQGTYVVRNSGLGEFSLLLVPSGPQMYTAIINHL